MVQGNELTVKYVNAKFKLPNITILTGMLQESIECLLIMTSSSVRLTVASSFTT